MLEKGYPSLWLIEAGGNKSEAYDGPKDLASLMEFVNDHTGRGPPNVKVLKDGFRFNDVRSFTGIQDQTCDQKC